jgi:hypothetical protein
MRLEINILSQQERLLEHLRLPQSGRLPHSTEANQPPDPADVPLLRATTVAPYSKHLPHAREQCASSWRQARLKLATSPHDWAGEFS